MKMLLCVLVLMGCIAMTINAEVLCWPEWFERLETPQIWQRHGRWHLYFGGAHDHEIPPKYLAETPPELAKMRRVNGVFIAETFDGPYKPAGRWWVTLPDGKSGYIHKVFPGPDGKDVLITTSGWRLSRPYPVTYSDDGSLNIDKPLVPSP